MADGSPGDIEVRSSDAERDATVMRLRDAAAEGRLTLEELAEWIEAADGARTRGELARLVEYLPSKELALETAPAPQRLYGFMGGDTLTGPVRLGRELRIVNVIGGADLDLSEAVLAEGELTIRVFSLFGGSNLVIPEGCGSSTAGADCSAGMRSICRARRPPPCRRTLRWCASAR